MSLSVSCSAVLLAGGRSSRMGRDKALLRMEGQTLWERQWNLLEKMGVNELFISTRPDQSWVPDHLTRVVDLIPDAGPLGGISAAMQRARNPHLLVLAVDLPQMDPKWFYELGKLCFPGVGAVGRGDGFYEPLAAIYPCELLSAAEASLAKGERSMQKFIASAGDAMRSYEISDQESHWFTNWNAPEDVPGG